MKAAFWVSAAALALWALTRLLEPRLTWFPLREVSAGPAAYGLRFEEVALTAPDGVRLRGWYCLPRAGVPHRADLVFFNGNAGNVGHRLAKIRSSRRPRPRRVHRRLPRLRPSGGARTTPRNSGRRGRLRGGEGARGRRPAARHLRRVHRRALRGAAGGGAPRHGVPRPRGSFPGKRAVVARLPPYWPFLPFLGGALEMGPAPGRVACPVLVMHARDDEVIPRALGRAVHDRLTGTACGSGTRSRAAATTTPSRSTPASSRASASFSTGSLPR